jgi:hypothetical protein
MAATGQFSSPPPGSFVAVSGQFLVAAVRAVHQGSAASLLVATPVRHWTVRFAVLRGVQMGWMQPSEPGSLYR